MTDLNLPKYETNMKAENGKTLIFDVIRKKYVALTPEEWVRQHIIHFFINDKGYPASLISVETTVMVNKLSRRCDILLYNNSGKPVMIVECKAPAVKISQKVFDQVAAYNLPVKVNFLVVSNGIQHYCCKLDHENSSWIFMTEIPGYSEIK